MIKVLLVEDQRLFREGINALIANEDDIEVVGMAQHGQDAIEQIEKLQPDVVLMDVHMPEVDGIKATIYIKENYPKIKVILLTTYPEEDLIITGISIGADGFLVKSIDRERLIRSIRDAYENQIVLAGEAARILAKRIEGFNYDKKEILDRKLKYRNIYLTGREIDVALLLMDGMTNNDIAQKLYLSQGTVKNYISEVYQKLDLRNRKDVIVFLHGLYTLDSFG